MNLRLILLSISMIATSAFADHYSGDPVPPAKNKDGSIVTGVLTAQFDPANGILPFPHNLLFTGTTDLTLNIPVDDPTNLSDPGVALSGLDGFSIQEKWVATFTDDNGDPGAINPASVVPGQSVRLFQVTTQQFLAVTSIVRELIPGVDYVAVASGNVVAIIPTSPLAEYSSYMAVLTNDIRDTSGNNATADTTYFLSKRSEPWVDANGRSTYELIDDSTAQSLEGLRQITATMEYAASAVGIDPADIILSWTVQTQSIKPTLKLLSSITEPAPIRVVPTGLTTAAVGGGGLADIYIGIITVPYYHGIPSAENPFAALTSYWKAEPGAYVPPFDAFGLDPNSTNITIANPFPVLAGMQTVPVIVTVPNANSGTAKPVGGWPVAMYMPALTRNRTDMLALADSFALVGRVGISMDQPMHGVVPAVEPALAPFYIENTPFAPIANERTFDADYFNNETGAFGPDGIMDRSGSSYFNLANLRAVRDYLRQAQADFLVLTASLQNVDLDGDQVPDLSPINVAGVSNSAGSFAGIPFMAVEDNISHAYINVAGALALRSAEGGYFGVQIRAGLAAEGVLPGTPDFEQFMLVGQTILEAGDPVGWARELVVKKPVLHNMVINDDTVPNDIPGSPLGGNEGLNLIMGLQSFSSTQANPGGLSVVSRFLLPAQHSSLFRPELAPAVTVEMQGEMASFIGSGGTFVNVGNPDLLQPVVQLKQLNAKQPKAGGDGGGKKPGRGGGSEDQLDAQRGKSPTE